MKDQPFDLYFLGQQWQDLQVDLKILGTNEFPGGKGRIIGRNKGVALLWEGSLSFVAADGTFSLPVPPRLAKLKVPFLFRRTPMTGL